MIWGFVAERERFLTRHYTAQKNPNRWQPGLLGWDQGN